MRRLIAHVHVVAIRRAVVVCDEEGRAILRRGLLESEGRHGHRTDVHVVGNAAVAQAGRTTQHTPRLLL